MPSKTKQAERLPPVQPGKILEEDLMKPLGLSMNRLAGDLHVPVTRISEIVLAGVPSPRIPPCNWPAISEAQRSSG